MSHGREESEFLDEFFEDSEDDDPERECSRCGGDGWQECPDPIQCTRPHNEFGECPCGSCGGSGLAKDMTVW
jgi:hypothetical protein